VKARADGNKKAGYTGPLLRYHSRRVGEGAELRCEARLPGRPQYKSRVGWNPLRLRRMARFQRHDLRVLGRTAGLPSMAVHALQLTAWWLVMAGNA
jgi:hypothetical protein